MAEAVVNDKSSDDGDDTAWDILMSEMGDDVVVDLDYLVQQKIRAKVPVANCMNIKDITNHRSFVPAILVKIGKNTWEVMDENDDHLIQQLDWDGDDGIKNMVSMYIKHITPGFCNHFKMMAKEWLISTPAKSDTCDDGITPR